MDSIFGNENFAFGPSKVYWDTATGGVNLDLGGTDAINFTQATAKLDLKESQAGDRAADKAIISQIPSISMGLARPTVERLANVLQGFHVEKDTGGNPIRIWGEDLTGQKDSAIRKQITIVEIVDGAEAWNDPFRVVDFFLAAPSTESAEWIFDATTQRYLNVSFLIYKHPTLKSDQNRPVYWASREQLP